MCISVVAGDGITGIPQNPWEYHGDGTVYCSTPSGMEKLHGIPAGTVVVFDFYGAPLHVQQQANPRSTSFKC